MNGVECLVRVNHEVGGVEDNFPGERESVARTDGRITAVLTIEVTVLLGDIHPTLT